ncbi:MAG TPA: Xaa-Pro peptidase family protein [Actinomycetota bacterium]|nr:Xaa-Pro peptidase family protein [Actinomycetota bacterium]
MGHDYQNRLARAAKEAAAANLDALVITPSPDLLYLIGYDAPLLERLTALIARASGSPLLIVPELERPRAAVSPAGKLLDIETWRDGEDPFDVVARVLSDGQRFGAADRMWAMHLLGFQRALPSSTFVLASVVMNRLRIRKDEGEVELLGRAGRSADDTFDVITREGLSGQREEAISRKLSELLVQNGCESAAFAIVGSGPNGASPHHEAGERTIESGDAVVLDFGGRVGGYCSDMTRTVSVGEPPAEKKEVHEIVRQAQEAAFQAVRPGVPAEEIDRAARRVISDAGYGDRFIHRIGHGIGLEEHEHPYIVEGNSEPLEPGMCFSIEPGIYLEGRFGVRIEDIVTVTEDGAVRLNNAPRELTVVT